jgi:asparagine synthase (glutamine-hydrolysing)
MSVINGIWHKDGQPLEKERLLKQTSINAKYAPDCTSVRHVGPIGMSFQGFHTHERSSFAPGPCEDEYGNSAVLDGRIDNGEALSKELGLSYDETGDTTLLLSAFRRWNEGCFNRIVGDWSVAIWDGKERSLYLARDHAGSRTLYYSETRDSVEWSTYPEPLIASSSAFELSEDYAVRYLACLPMGDLTPYERIRAVPSGHYLRYSQNSLARKKRHWNPDLRTRVACRSDESYQDEFLTLLRQAVKRRVAGSNNVICQLSGGMDSSAIVCVADLLAKAGELSEQVRTLSFYDPTEPNWDDHLYYTVVEAQRRQVGTHISGSLRKETFQSASVFYPLPGADSNSMERELEFEGSIGPGTIRAIVAGYGGDELLGGRSDPIPELADYLWSFQWRTFVARAYEYARSLRRPMVAITQDACRFIWNQYPRPRRAFKKLPPWLQRIPEESARSAALRLWQRQTMGHLPSELDKQDTWENLADTLPHLFHANVVRYEYRYPFLDKDLVEFLLRVPLNQLRRPNRRRYMMRRALEGIIPEEILERKRKAYVSRTPVLTIRENIKAIAASIANGAIAKHNLVDTDSFLQALSGLEGSDGSLQWLVAIRRAIELELWMNQVPQPAGHGKRLGITGSVWPIVVQVMQKFETRGAP